MTYTSEIESIRTKLRDHISSNGVGSRLDIVTALADIALALGEVSGGGGGGASTVTANLGTLNGAATDSTLSTFSTKVPANLTVLSTRLLVDGSGVTQPVSIASPLPVTQSGTWNINSIATLPSLPTGTNSIGTVVLSGISSLSTESTLSALNTKVPANLTVNSTRLLVDGSGVTQPVSLASTSTVKQEASNTATVTSVASSATSVTLIASNSARKGLTIYNDSTSILYVRVGAAAASTTAFTVKIQPEGYWEIPFNSSVEIRGIWASANGSARITEFT